MDKIVMCKVEGVDVKEPIRAHEDDAGIDFFVPNNFEKTYLFPGKDILIPSGIRVVVPEGYALIAKNKSGVATKKKLSVGACVIDSGYRNQVHIHLYNFSNDTVIIEPGDKIVQFVLVKIGLHIPEFISEKEYEETYLNTERGLGGFGSSGAK